MIAVVVIPTFNEKENVSSLLPKIQEAFSGISGWKLEILVVDDNSPDGTGDVVRHFAKKSKNVHLLLREKKEGLGAAYLAGMKEAFEKMGASLVITMDADLSHKPEYLADFLEEIEQGTDFVIGSRYISGGTIPPEWPIQRKLLSVFGNRIVAVFLGNRKLTDWTSGYRAMRKSVYKRVRRMTLEDRAEFRGYTFNISFAYHTVAQGFKVAETPIKFPDRKKGESKLGLEYLIHTPIFLVKTRLKMLLGGKVKV